MTDCRWAKLLFLPRTEIPDQLHKKLSLGLLGGVAIVRLDWELDKGVPGTNA